jgi:protease-4
MNLPFRNLSISKGFLFTLFILNLCHGLDAPFTSDLSSPISDNPGAFGNPAGKHKRFGKLTTLGLVLDENTEFYSLRFDHLGKYLGYGYRYSDSSDQSEFATAAFIPFSKNSSVGLRIKYTSIDNITNWKGDIGFQWAPFSALKAGYYTEGLSQSNAQERGQQFMAVGIRPLDLIPGIGHRLTASFEIATPGFDTKIWKNGTYSVFGDLQLFSWLHFQGRKEIRKGDDFSFGFFIQQSPYSLLGYNRTAREGGKALNEYLGQLNLKAKKKFIGLPAKVVMFDLDQKIVEGQVEKQWFTQPNKTGHINVLGKLKFLEESRGLEIVIVKIGDIQCDWAIAADIRQALFKLKEKKIKVVAFMESSSRLNYYLATAADTIIMPPSSYFNVRGIAAEVAMYKGLLDKVGVEAQFVRHGNYKSFPEIFTREKMSEQWKSNLQATINSLWNSFMKSVSLSRDIPMDSLKEIFARADLSLERAQSAGLIDTLLYEDQVLEYLNQMSTKIYTPPYEGLVNQDWSEGKEIALIMVEGSITQGKSSQGGLFSFTTSGSKTLAGQIRKAGSSNSIKAVVLRINSPGGSAIASDMIWRELELLKQKGKPIIVSIGGSCASGGYYIACAGDMLIAQENSIVGSIGIFGGKFILKGLYDKLGIKKEVLTTIAHADAPSDYRKWDADEEKAIQKYMDDFYNRFIDVVKEGRHISKDSVDSLADGRIFTGRDAISAGLIDTIGGLETAIEIAKLLIGVRKDKQARLVTLEEDDENFRLSLIETKTSPVQALKEDMETYMEQISRTEIWALSPEAMVLSIKNALK